MQQNPKLLTRAIMTSPVETILRGTSAHAAAEKMSAKGVRHLVVVDARQHVLGVVSDRDLRSAQPSMLLVPDAEMRKKALSVLKVDDIMTRHPRVVYDDEPTDSALEVMLKHLFGCLPVVDRSGDLVGIVTGTDVTRLALRLIRASAG
jgi:CBS domain-containing protein